jgi:hypothetical protein
MSRERKERRIYIYVREERKWRKERRMSRGRRG